MYVQLKLENGITFKGFTFKQLPCFIPQQQQDRWRSSALISNQNLCNGWSKSGAAARPGRSPEVEFRLGDEDGGMSMVLTIPHQQGSISRETKGTQ